jgi:hypothetical protein
MSALQGARQGWEWGLPDRARFASGPGLPAWVERETNVTESHGFSLSREVRCERLLRTESHPLACSCADCTFAAPAAAATGRLPVPHSRPFIRKRAMLERTDKTHSRENKNQKIRRKKRMTGSEESRGTMEPGRVQPARGSPAADRTERYIGW